jgi:peptidoglycan-associated lipoprotein
LNSRKLMLLTLPLVATLALTGCPPKKNLPIDDKTATEEPTAEDASATDAAAGVNDIQIAQDWTEIPALETIRFDYDSVAIDDAARTSLKTNVAILKKLPTSVKIRVEGHCDDRGTIEYNIALGQRRANAVRQYYVTAGVNKSRLETISFGEERPLCTAATDECYAMNRRGATKVRNAEAITINPDSLR